MLGLVEQQLCPFAFVLLERLSLVEDAVMPSLNTLTKMKRSGQ